MSDTDNDETMMAECGSCRAVIPSDSTECPECNIKFSGISEDELGECGACGFLVPLESTSCSSCGVIFVADDVMDVLRKWLSNTGLSIKSLFDKFDTNGDGMIDSEELKQGLLNLNLADLPPSQVERLVEKIDIDGNGEIDLAELEKSVTGSDYVAPKDEEEDSPEEAEEEAEEESEEETEEESEEEAEEETDEESEEEAEEETDEEAEDDDEDESDTEESVEILPNDIVKMMIAVMEKEDSNPATIFHALDEDGDKFISTEELSNTINDVLEGEDIAESSIADFVATLDVDSDGNIDIIEFVSALEDEIAANPEEYDDDDDNDDDDYDDGTDPKVFPSPMQSAMMSKKWNDVWWPLIHAAFFLFILAWVVNGFIGPVDGSGGPIELESNWGMGSGDYAEGDIYPCDSEEQKGGCSNSLTPFSGENGASSMPKGFYTDGIVFILLGAIGMGGSMFTHLVLAKGWRARVKAMKEVESDTEDAKESSDSEEEENSDSESEEESTDDEEQVEEESEEEDDDESDDEDDGEEEDDDIDIGSHIGLTVEGEDVFGVIVEFDDEDGLVTIKEDGTGDELTGYQDEMFLE